MILLLVVSNLFVVSLQQTVQSNTANRGILGNIINNVKDTAQNITNNVLNSTSEAGFIDIGLNNVSIDSLGWFALKESDVQFRLVTRRTCLNYQIIHIGIRNNSFMDPKQPFKFMTHGFQSGIDTIWAYNMTAEYVKKDDYNVIQVDWSQSAKAAYPLVARYTQSVGLYVAKLIADLNKNFSVPLSNIHLIGHSLGAHIMGFAGAYVQQYMKAKVSRITGLDPAGPLFLTASASNRLEKTDASFVDIIHTDGRRYGYYDPFGTVDFYPNGGIAVQPPCRSGLQLAGDLVGAGCSHGFSHEYFTESIRSENFISRQCTSYVAYKLEEFRRNSKYQTAIMGENVSFNSSGVFYLDVNSEPPFAKGGIRSFF